MKTIISIFKVFVICFLSITNRIYAQHMPEELLATSVLIELDHGSGSGFYVQDSLHTYLVTARHVLIDKIITNNKTQKDSVVLTAKKIKCISYPANPFNSKKVILNVDLEAAFQLGFLKYKLDSDIGIIQLGDVKKINDSLTLTGYYLFAQKDRSSKMELIPRSIISEYNDVHVGDDVFVFGYPTSIGIHQSPQFDPERPLLRKGTVAGKNNDKRTIIIDCPVYYGNSGGPVIVEYIENLVIYYKLIGVISEFIPYEEDWINKNNGLININISNSGYSVVVPIESIFELFEK